MGPDNAEDQHKARFAVHMSSFSSCTMDKSSVPFTVRVLDDAVNPAVTVQEPRDWSDLLPATSRSKHDHITVPQADDIEFLEQELLVRRLNDVQDLLWICGRPMPPRPLHYQTISREIHITENPELHLVWAKNRIFVKPIPRWLLSPDFWAANLVVASGDQSDPRKQQLVSCALGFLFTYTALIAYESDFRIAVERGLLPDRMNWYQWKAISAQIAQNHCYASVNPRYWYGELRLSRLNKIYRVRLGYLLRGYSKVVSHAVYEDLIRDNFATLAAMLGYVVIVLTAMQVGLATDRLVGDSAFQSVSYGFTVFSILAPLIAGVCIIGIVLVMFVSSWGVTKVYEKKRFQEMGVEPFWRFQKTANQYTKLPGQGVDPTFIEASGHYNTRSAGPSYDQSAVPQRPNVTQGSGRPRLSFALSTTVRRNHIMAAKPATPLERHCLVTVGATARFTQLLTEVLSAAFLDHVTSNRYTHLTLQCGKDYAEFSRQMLPPLLNEYPGIEITAFDFVDDLTTEMVKCRAQAGVREAGVVICHAGTGTILDGMRVSVPLVVVPNPTLKDNHQVELAEEIQRQGYGIWGRLGDIAWALEQLALQLDKTEQQYRPHPVATTGAAPVDVDVWQVSGALMNRYADEPGHAAAAPETTKASDGGGGGGAGKEVQREEVAQMTMG
ncbi:uncharacterized protein CLUP02_10227 [Colletotrichum lupini]|uniref:UDP-N-acetylglucosamine transferase subunit ALG13 n=1 Tax=Colletotrichum lupini TaxID=145971 RepID=A0A9Q8SXX3_9PEZI|nr:uncharacterized protein CLUP02_10227 [Colletotrichum lupini]UQC84731.1 hypothetical protein CLUP02_10227 [Colletotrichum lupini]